MLGVLKMNKTELIEKARTAILKGDKRVDGYYIYVSKIDLDTKLCEYDRVLWEHTRRAILESMGHIVVDVNTSDTERGAHTVVNHLYTKELSDYTQNFLQLLLGDDLIRFKINQRRIEKGIKFENANILFSKILKRYPHEESRLKLALERITGDI